MKARLLLIEDSEAQGNALKDKLTNLGYDVDWVKSGIDGLKLARSQHPDLVLLDVVMAGLDGFAVCRWLKSTTDTRDIPIIMLTNRNDVQGRVEGLNVGANDYLAKTVSDDELDARVLAALRVRIAHSELRERNRQLEAMIQRVEVLAVTDPLTGLYNRRRFTDALRREFAATRRYRNALSCLLLDIDHFKIINDRYGHDTGDVVLRQVAEICARSIREIDVVCRYGGEEFAILLPHTAKENALVVAERIVRAVRHHQCEVESNRISVTVSAGVSAASDVITNDPEDLVRFADAAMYEAKHQGRDRIVTYSTAPESPLP